MCVSLVVEREATLQTDPVNGRAEATHVVSDKLGRRATAADRSDLRSCAELRLGAPCAGRNLFLRSHTPHIFQDRAITYASSGT